MCVCVRAHPYVIVCCVSVLAVHARMRAGRMLFSVCASAPAYSFVCAGTTQVSPSLLCIFFCSGLRWSTASIDQNSCFLKMMSLRFIQTHTLYNVMPGQAAAWVPHATTHTHTA